MSRAIIENTNKIVGENDILWLLGDFLFERRENYLNRALEFRKQIKCKNIHYVYGNHDQTCLNKVFETCHDLVKVSVDPHSGNYWIGDECFDKESRRGQLMVLCHYALSVWENSSRGSWCLYGHSHSNAEESLDKMMPNRKSIDVGIDNAFKILGEYRPFSFSELNNILSKRSGCSIDHH